MKRNKVHTVNIVFFLAIVPVCSLYSADTNLSSTENNNPVRSEENTRADENVKGLIPNWRLSLARPEQESKIQFRRTSKDPDKNKSDNKNTQYDFASERILNPDNWYLKFSTNINYFNMGNDILKVLSQVESMFGGSQIDVPLSIFNTSFSMTTEKEISRASTNFVPTGNLGLGFLFGQHQIEFEFGIAGLVPLNTINKNTVMTLTESNDCTQANSDLNLCPMAKLGFVDRATRSGKYDLEITMNEDIWLLAPAVNYDYIITRKEIGRLSAGATAGMMILSASQKIAFKAKRTDLSANSANIPDLLYNDRIMEGTADSYATNDVGPIFRIYAGLRRPVKSFQMDIRIGFNYGFVYLHRDVDGSGKAVMGNTLAASFPTTSLGFKSKETNKFEMMGFFIQMGVLF